MARRLTFAALLAAVVLSCSGGDGGAKVAGGAVERSTTTTTTEPAPTTTTAVPGPTLPLLGTAGEGPARPALVVKYDNAPLARPPVGINTADVVYEEMVEGGITRLFAVFHSTDADPVGPVRSARSTDIGLAAPLHRPLFAYSGANGGVLGLLAAAPLVDVGHDAASSAYRRDGGRPAPHDLLSSTAALWARAPADAVPPPALFHYRADGEALPGTARPAFAIQIEYRRIVLTVARWDWHAAGGVWARAQNGTPHVDGGGTQIAPVNVVVQLVEYRDTGGFDVTGEPIPEAVLVGEGEAWVFTAGHMVPARWRKTAPEAVTEYLDADGAPIGLTPGRTWVELAPLGSAAFG